jgi:hypothetical protein
MRQDVYRVAHDEAQLELVAIEGRFEQLCVRKERLERLIEAIGPMVGMEVPVSAPVAEETQTPSPIEPEPISEPLTYSFHQVPVPLPDLDETGGDPFKRRVRDALKLKTAV